MRLYIIRHGETAWNKAKRLQGHTDIPLNEEGIRLAKMTAEGMKDLKIDMVISSPLERAKTTAKLVIGKRDIPFITDARIEEICFGDWEGENIFSSEIMPHDFMETFFTEPLKCIQPPNGEKVQEVCERTKEFYESLIANEKYKDLSILISTHGCAGRCLLCNFYDDKDDIWRGGVPKNCSVSIVDIEDGKPTLIEKDHIFGNVCT